MTTLILTTLFVIVATLIMADLLANTEYTVRFLDRAGQLFAFAIGVGALAIYCLWCWIRGKQPTNIFT